MKFTILLSIFCAGAAFANPYPDPSQVPKDGPDVAWTAMPPRVRILGKPVLRVDVPWNESQDTFTDVVLSRESSGTDALEARSKGFDGLGSYVGRIVALQTGQILAVDAVGTGATFRKLARQLTFRFPFPAQEVEFQLVAEDPQSGQMVEVMRRRLSLLGIATPPALSVETRLLRAASLLPSLKVVVYGEGYEEREKSRFFSEARKVVSTLEGAHFPEEERMEFIAAFAPSTEALGSATNLGLPVEERDSFLGLYFPYWHPFGRWYHVVYPTSETRFRDRIGQVPYDYPIALVDSSSYWGVGNFMELTAVPSRSSSFSYLLLHEFGHYFGLNEEYESGGATELAFAPRIGEPWSQNITFSTNPLSLKWRAHVTSGTPIPTPKSQWTGSGPWGAYAGGYAETEPKGRSHKPGWSCTMSSGRKFCPVCAEALRTRVRRDAGL